MTNEEKQLLLKDLCTRLPYGVKFQGEDSNVYTLDAANYFALQVEDMIFKPYLRPMSSMTEEERKELSQISEEYLDDWSTADSNLVKWKLDAKVSSMRATFYNSHYLDWNDLISKGLALEAPEDMYKKEN